MTFDVAQRYLHVAYITVDTSLLFGTSTKPRCLRIMLVWEVVPRCLVSTFWRDLEGMLCYFFSATNGQFVTLYCCMCLINNQKWIYTEFVCDVFIIREMAITLRFEIMFDSIAVLKLGMFKTFHWDADQWFHVLTGMWSLYSLRMAEVLFLAQRRSTYGDTASFDPC